MECLAWNVKRGVWRVKCEVQRVEWRVWSAKSEVCGVWGVKCEVCSMECAV